MNPSSANQSIDQVWQWLDRRDRLLLVAHERPDGDAFASVLGLFLALRELGKKTQAYFSVDSIPTRYRPLFSRVGLEPGLCLATDTPAISDFDGLICLDTANWARADLPAGMSQETAETACCNIDHHPDNSAYGQVNWIDESYAATAQMVMAMLQYRGLKVSPDCATLLLTGLVADTGGFRFQNTDAKAMRAAAAMIDGGADYAAIVDALYFNEPFNKMRLKTYLLENSVFAFDNRLLYAVMEPAMIEKLGLCPADTEDCIDVLRVVAGVQVACLVQPVEDGVRFSLRSRRLPYNVAEMARQLGGGGHPMAAGVNLPNIDLEKGLQRFLTVLEKWFEK